MNFQQLKTFGSMCKIRFFFKNFRNYIRQWYSTAVFWSNTYTYIYTTLLLARSSNIWCKMVEHNKCSDMANCSWTYRSRRVLLWGDLISATFSWTASTTKMMPFKSPFNCLWLLQEKYIWEHKEGVQEIEMSKDDILNVFNFQQRCCLHIVATTDVKYIIF